MKHFRKPMLLAFGFAIVAVALAWPPNRPAAAAAGVPTASGMAVNPPTPVTCRPVHGMIHSVLSPPQNCTSPVGLCTTGTIVDAGLLDGTTTFIAKLVAPSAGLPGIEPPENLSYSGQLTIMTSSGTLVTRDLGVVDFPHLAFTEIERPASGTGVFANPGNSVFFISGSVVDNQQGFQGDLTGTICVGDN